MAMITCPNCGEQVSDKAKKCVHCGTVLIEEEKVLCAECGAEIEEGAEVCSKCGCPVEQKKSDSTPQEVNVTGIRLTQKSKKVITIAAMVLLVAVLAIFGIGQAQKKAKAKAAEAESAEYAIELNSVIISMLEGSREAESCGNLVRNVWYNTIFKESDSETDKYTRPRNGIFEDDFNDALNNLYSDTIFSIRISGIKENQDTVSSKMKSLTNPPAEWEDAYKAVKEMYDAYLKFTNMVVSPSGSLQTFTSDFSDADTAVLNAYRATEMYF